MSEHFHIPDSNPRDPVTIAAMFAPALVDEIRAEFDALAEQWKRETGMLSNTKDKYLHPTYQRIIGMGWAVVPLLIKDLNKQPAFWFWALRAITGENPATAGMDVTRSIMAWTDWQKSKSSSIPPGWRACGMKK